jgi:D-aminopeptidase
MADAGGAAMPHASAVALTLLPLFTLAAGPPAGRPRAREAGVVTGILQPGPLDAITDVAGVRVGQVTLVEGDDVRTGVTVVLPHGGNVFREKVPAAVFVTNGFGKLTGVTQVEELGTLETPIALTGTLNTFRVADALIDWVLALPGNEDVLSVNPVVGECNDGTLSDIRRRPVGREQVLAALAAAGPGPVPEGTVGAGAGTIALGWKGGIGSASRRLPPGLGGWTVGVLVQSNFGGALTVAGVPVGVALGRYRFREELAQGEHGSCMVVVATDAPVDARQLRRMVARTPLGLARVGAFASNGSGDYAIAFTAHPQLRVAHGGTGVTSRPLLADDDLSPLLLAVIEATEEAVLNSLFRATTVRGFQGHEAEALPLEPVLALLHERGALATPAPAP